MNLLQKSVISFAGVTAAALLLAVASPRTVHALGGIGDTLVSCRGSPPYALTPDNNRRLHQWHFKLPSEAVESRWE
jgi:hypothetical protein